MISPFTIILCLYGILHNYIIHIALVATSCSSFQPPLPSHQAMSDHSPTKFVAMTTVDYLWPQFTQPLADVCSGQENCTMSVVIATHVLPPVPLPRQSTNHVFFDSVQKSRFSQSISVIQKSIVMVVWTCRKQFDTETTAKFKFHEIPRFATK